MSALVICFFNIFEWILIFRDQDVADKCEELCELEYVDCTLACSDTNCLIECGRALTNCVEGKPTIHQIKFREKTFRLSV